MIRRAQSTRAASGEKTSLIGAICAGWIAHFPSKPRARERIAEARSPAASRKSA